MLHADVLCHATWKPAGSGCRASPTDAEESSLTARLLQGMVRPRWPLLRQMARQMSLLRKRALHPCQVRSAAQQMRGSRAICTWGASVVSTGPASGLMAQVSGDRYRKY